MKLVIRADADSRIGTGHIMRCIALAQAWREDDNPAWREHVTTYIRRYTDLFHTYGVLSNENYSYMRWTVDTPKDLAFVRCIYRHFGHDQFSWQEVLGVLKEHPKWLKINRDVRQKVV